MTQCPCFYFDFDYRDVDGLVVCACGHVEDEHDDLGNCEAGFSD